MKNSLSTMIRYHIFIIWHPLWIQLNLEKSFFMFLSWISRLLDLYLLYTFAQKRHFFSSKHVGVKNTAFLWPLILTQKLLGNYVSNFIQKLSLWEWSIIKIDLFFVFKSCGQVFKSNLDFGVPNGNEVVNLGSLLPPQKLTTSHGPR